MTLTDRVTMAALIALALALWTGYRRRLLEHRERLAAIEKGVPVPGPDARDFLRRGIVLVATGLGIAACLFFFGFTQDLEDRTEMAGFALLGLVPVSMGIGYLLFYKLDPARRGG